MSGFDSLAIEALVDRARTPVDVGDVKEQVSRALASRSLSNHDRGQLLLAQIVGSQGELGADEATAKAAEAVALLRSTGDSDALTSALAISAVIAAATGDRAKCLDLCLDMWSVIRARPGMELSFRASANFGASLVVLGAYDLAAPLFVNAIHESAKNSEPIGMIVSAVNLAMALSRQRLVSKDVAITTSQADHLDLIENTVRDIKAGELGSEMQAFKRAALADVATMRGDLDEAVAVWGDLDALSAHPGQSFVQYFCLVEAPLAFHRNEFERAHTLIERALEHLSTPHIVPLGRVDALGIRSRLHERQGNLAAALADAREATELALRETNGLADLLIGQVDQRAVLEETQRALLDHTTHLTEQALVDELSQLGNRRAFEAAIELARMRPALNFAVLTCDIDDFKGVNDRYGHNVGDAAIARIGAIAANAAGGAGRAFRYGGDEFVLLPGEMIMADALALANQVCQSFTSERWTELGIDDPLTCSVGVWVGTSTDIDKGLRDADAQLYAAKHAGRNCVRPVSPTSASAGKELARIIAGDGPSEPLAGVTAYPTYP